MIRTYFAVAAVAAILAAAAAVYFWGRSDANDANRLEDLQDQAETNERINDADTGSGDPDDDRRWLHDRGGR